MAAIVGAAGPGARAWRPRAPASACCWPTRKRWWWAASSSCSAVRAGRRRCCCRSTASIQRHFPVPAARTPRPGPRRVEKIILTASGGPFPHARAGQPAPSVTPEQACAHPNWVMGRKISVDSATMMNKALEVIEAHYLFGLPAAADRGGDPPAEHHPFDGAVPRQLGGGAAGHPRHARAHCLRPGLARTRVVSGAAALDFHVAGRHDLRSPAAIPSGFPACGWPGMCSRPPPARTAVLNAANEVAVAAFLDKRIRFDQIHQTNVAALAAVSALRPDNARRSAGTGRAGSRGAAQAVISRLTVTG